MLAFIQGWEWVIILLAVLLLFGAKKLPELAKGLGKGIREFKKASSEISYEMDREAERQDYERELALVILALRFPVHLVADFARGFLKFADALAEALGQLREFLSAKEQENGQKDNDPFPTLNKCQHVRVH